MVAAGAAAAGVRAARQVQDPLPRRPSRDPRSTLQHVEILPIATTPATFQQIARSGGAPWCRGARRWTIPPPPEVGPDPCGEDRAIQLDVDIIDPCWGSIDRAKLNVNGSSLAAGHPFAATGGRIVATLAKLLHEKGSGRGLISICAAGGQGVTAILEK